MPETLSKQAAIEAELGRRLTSPTTRALIDRSQESPEQIVDRMLASLPGAHPADRKLGPFYDTAGLVGWLGLSRQRIHTLARSGRILALKTADGELVYPAFQFAADRSLLPGLAKVLAVLERGTASRWQHALWLNTPDDDGTTAVATLRAGRVDDVLAEASRDAAGWAA